MEKENEKHKEKEKEKEKEKDKEKEPEAEGEAVQQQKQELHDIVVVVGAKGKEGEAKERKPKGKEKGKDKGKEKAGGVGNAGFKIEGAVGPQKSMPAKTTRFKHYKESTQFMNHCRCFSRPVYCFSRASDNASKGVCRVMRVIRVPVSCFQTSFWRTFVCLSCPSGCGVRIGGVWGDAGTT